MYVCICKGITDRAIREQVAAGARSLAEVSRRTGCSTQCGKCSCFAESLVSEAVSRGGQLQAVRQG
ncbi:MAG: (2Fe-2S)-binding protein [Alteromonadaceae bacterium]|nr:(2Fe-2S)-binding protein [Alteromonadaceae bacterium]MBL6703151.1 (2Fe-2S)-binding protein [Pseudomonadales bacterium]MBL6823160.1 (2Fe-2S)-binding protein [Luminiphilus sp.]MDA0891589.1 (2Fe-2S)-binding protein [Pseudomonadota bacterium]RCL46624.1 MAG: (2Fe-2S)-binding protein [Halieaceae bacterium]RPH11988.1 MAG: (2Fe-2S)-binding protein [Alteromonadaceae bacterium TMED101]